jgi:hypothetical protein
MIRGTQIEISRLGWLIGVFKRAIRADCISYACCCFQSPKSWLHIECPYEASKSECHIPWSEFFTFYVLKCGKLLKLSITRFVLDKLELFFCSHGRAIFYYIEALTSSCTFWGVKSSSLSMWTRYVAMSNFCREELLSLMA